MAAVLLTFAASALSPPPLHLNRRAVHSAALASLLPLTPLAAFAAEPSEAALIDEIKELKRNPSKRQRPSGREAKAKQEAQAEPDGTLREVDFSGFRPQDDRRR